MPGPMEQIFTKAPAQTRQVRFHRAYWLKYRFSGGVHRQCSPPLCRVLASIRGVRPLTLTLHLTLHPTLHLARLAPSARRWHCGCGSSSAVPCGSSSAVAPGAERAPLPLRSWQLERCAVKPEGYIGSIRPYLEAACKWYSEADAGPGAEAGSGCRD